MQGDQNEQFAEFGEKQKYLVDLFVFCFYQLGVRV